MKISFNAPFFEIYLDFRYKQLYKMYVIYIYFVAKAELFFRFS